MSDINKLVAKTVHHCLQRHPEALDQIFDNLPRQINQEVVLGTVASLEKDIETLSWFCSYMASEINKSQTKDLAKALIEAGMRPFEDFTPYLGSRLAVINTEKFATLPAELKAKMQIGYDAIDVSPEQFEQMSKAIIAENQ